MSGFLVWKSAICLILLSLLTRLEASILTDCRRETQVSWESLRSLNTGNFSTSDQRVKCYVKCYMSKIGVLDENGHMDFDVLRRLTPDYRVLITKFGDCFLASGADPCDKAFQIAKCVATREKVSGVCSRVHYDYFLRTTHWTILDLIHRLWKFLFLTFDAP